MCHTRSVSVRTGKSLFFPLTKLAVSFTELLIYVKGFSGQIEQMCPFSDQWLNNTWLPLEELE